MRKILSSFFILSIFLLVLWSVSAWFLGKNNLDRLTVFVQQNQAKPNPLLSFQISDYSTSILGAKATLITRRNPDHISSNILTNLPEEWFLSVDIKNGPILFNKTGLSFGKSSWEISIDENSSIPENNNEDNDEDNKYHFKQLPTAYLIHSFDNIIKYTVPIESNVSELLIEGSFNSKNFNNMGSITTKKIVINERTMALQFNDVDLKYKGVFKQSKDGINLQKLFIKSSMPDMNIKHKNMHQSLNIKAIYNGNLEILEESINSNNSVDFNNLNQTYYPTDQGNLNLKVSDLDLSNLNQLFDHLSQIESFQQQSQWILDEQGELPEGQDKIWQLQDQANRHKKQLASLTTQAITSKNNEKPIFSFTLLSQYKNKQSKLNGYLDVINSAQIDRDYFENSFTNLTQVNADVSLDKVVYDFISKQLPINKPQFKLIYKQNKLLMQ